MLASTFSRRRKIKPQTFLPNGGYEGYMRVRVLGRGMHGSAVLLTHPQSGALVVSKELTITASEKESTASDVANEIAILASLHHSHIVAYLGSFKTDCVLSIVMEYAPGGTLSEAIEQAKQESRLFTLSTVMRWLTQLASAMHYMHSRRVLHRDLKAGNIFLTSLHAEADVKIGDFGVSRMLSTQSNMAHTVCGTPYYLSPELVRGSAYSEPSDVWALGVLLFELITLQRPFTAPNIGCLVLRIASCEYDETSLRDSTHPWWLKALVAGCSLLEPQPQTRLTLDALLLQIVTWQARARRLQRSVRDLRQLSFSARTFANIAQRHCTEPELPLQTSGVKAPERCFVNHHGLFDSDVHESAVSSSRMSGGTVLDAISCTCGKPSCECELDRTNSITVAPNLSSSSSMTVNSSGAGHCDKQEHLARRSTNDASGVTSPAISPRPSSISFSHGVQRFWPSTTSSPSSWISFRSSNTEPLSAPASPKKRSPTRKLPRLTTQPTVSPQPLLSFVQPHPRSCSTQASPLLTHTDATAMPAMTPLQSASLSSSPIRHRRESLSPHWLRSSPSRSKHVVPIETTAHSSPHVRAQVPPLPQAAVQSPPALSHSVSVEEGNSTPSRFRSLLFHRRSHSEGMQRSSKRLASPHVSIPSAVSEPWRSPVAPRSEISQPMHAEEPNANDVSTRSIDDRHLLSPSAVR